MPTKSSSTTKSLIEPWPNAAMARLFLRGLVQGDESALQTAVVAIHQENIASDAIIRWLRFHGLASLAWHCLPKNELYQPWRELLRADVFRHAAFSIILQKQVDEIVAHLQELEIPVVVLKGVALARTVYPEFHHRPMGDVDLLVPRQQVISTVKALGQLGYVESSVERMQEDVHDWGHRHYPMLLAPEAGQVGVEVHWTLSFAESSWIKSHTEWFWSRTIPYDEGKENVFILDPVAMLLHLALHLTMEHGLNQIVFKWLTDIHYLVNPYLNPSDDKFWQDVLASAKQTGWSGAVFAALEGIQSWLGTDIPSDVLIQLEQDADPHMMNLIHFRTGGETTKTKSAFGELMALKGTARWKKLIVILFPSPAYMRWRYKPTPQWLWPLTYFRRLFDVSVDVAKTIIGGFGQKRK